jgi:hypothetical protein
MPHREAVLVIVLQPIGGFRVPPHRLFSQFLEGEFSEVSSPKFATTCNALATVKITLLRDALVLAAGVGYQTLRS